MKNCFLPLFAVALVSAASCSGRSGAPAFIDGNDSRAVYDGRVLKSDSTVCFDWSGVSARVRFFGTRLSVDYTDTKSDYFNVWVDREPGVRADGVVIASGSGTLELASGLAEGEHTVVMQKRTEGEQGMMTVRGFSTDGRFLKAERHRGRTIEFVGDSYTCGFGTEGGKDEPFKASTENCNLAYAAIIGRFFDARIQTVCHSGRGLVRNYGGADCPVMTRLYGQVFDEYDTVAYDAHAAGFKPDIVVVYLGTNDFSCGERPSLDEWCVGFAGLLASIRANYGPGVPVLCVSSRAYRLLADYVEEGVKRCADPDVSWTSVERDVHNDGSDLGAVGHPNYEGHRKVACQMIPYISTLTGWEMPLKAVE